MVVLTTVLRYRVHCDMSLLLLGVELLAERCRTDDSIPVLCLPPSRVDPKVLGPNVFVYHSQPGGSARRSPPIRWWSQRGGDDTVVVLLYSIYKSAIGIVMSSVRPSVRLFVCLSITHCILALRVDVQG